MARFIMTLVVLAAAVAVASAQTDKYRTALMDLYTATGGASWKNNSGWGTSAHYCTWFGVSCPLHTTRDITEINLSGNGLSGPLPATIGACRAAVPLPRSTFPPVPTAAVESRLPHT